MKKLEKEVLWYAKAWFRAVENGSRAGEILALAPLFEALQALVDHEQRG